MANAMPSLAPFDVHTDPSSVNLRWKKWLRRFEDAMVGFDITDAKRQRALLLHYGGEQLHDLFDTLSDTGKDFKIEAKLKELQDNDIIEDATGATPWVSPLMAIPKPKNPSDIRLCVDMRAANKAIKRERHDTPTVEEIIAELNGSRFFSKVDLNSGYHQLQLAPESRYITTFATHIGLKRYKRLSFGINSAAEVFQQTIRQSLEGLYGVLSISDDILVYAKSQEEHDQCLMALCKRLNESGLTVNSAKCEFNKTRLEFFGMVFKQTRTIT